MTLDPRWNFLGIRVYRGTQAEIEAVTDIPNVAFAYASDNGLGFYDGVVWHWVSSDGITVWGDVTGTLSDQTDLQDVLDVKLDAAVIHALTETTIVTDDEIPFYDDSAGVLKKVTWEQVQNKIETQVNNSMVSAIFIRGERDCSANPNYDVAVKGDAYIVTVAGKIGGASGKSVDVGDVFIASANNAGGTEAAVGTSWFVLEHNLNIQSPTATDDFLLGTQITSVWTWTKKTLAETITILRATLNSVYATLAHAAQHKSAGNDSIKLDELAATTDVTTLNASTSAHGLVVKATAPAANVLNIVGIANGETAYTNKAMLDGTNPAAIGSVAPGTSLIAAHRDHVHAGDHANLSTIGTNTHAQIDTHIANTSNPHSVTAIQAAAVRLTTLEGRHLLPFGVYTHISPISASPANPYAAAIDRDFTCKKITYSFVVLTTNNGSNYWTIQLRTFNTILKDLTTAAGTAGVWQSVASSTFTVSSVPAADIIIYLECTKTGSPGNLYMGGPMLEISIP